MKRKVVSLSSSLERGLKMYTLAASAAGVGVLALGQTAEARIVYTKTRKSVGVNTIFRLDLNHDGITDFELKNNGKTYFGSPGGSLLRLCDSAKE